jgi:1-acyl-sn-glycerol-3-phosphate acyltransferase
MEVEGFEEALARPGYDAEGRRRTWNHRVVRRYKPTPEALSAIYGDEQCWLEVTEVHYVDGKPDSYAVEMGTPMTAREPGEPIDDEALLVELRETLQRMIRATEEPILDQKIDFAGDEPVEIEYVK